MSTIEEDKQLSEKLGLLKESYKEVLDATKHQDDKVGRFLTAVSFLIAGAIALGTRTELVKIAYQLEPSPAKPVLLPAYLLSLFLLFIVLSLLFLVAGIGARLHRPTGKSSHLFFLMIADMEEGDEGEGTWKRLWNGESKTIGTDLEKEYKDEIVNIAKRAKRKYNRTVVAGAFLQLAALCLVLAAALGFLAEGFHQASSGATDWNRLLPRLVATIIIASFAAGLAFDYVWFERGSFDDEQRPLRFMLVFACPLYVTMALVHPFSRVHELWNTFGYYGGAGIVEFVMVGVVAVSAAKAFSNWRLRIAAAVTALAVFIIAPAWFEAIHELQLGQLAAAGMVVVILLALRVFKEPRVPDKEPRVPDIDVRPDPSPGRDGRVVPAVRAGQSEHENKEAESHEDEPPATSSEETEGSKP